MRRRFAGLTVTATALLVAACADAPDPVGPINTGSNALLAAQGALDQVFDRAWPEVMALPGTVFADHEEVGNRLVFGVEHAGAARGVSIALSRMGIPASAFEVRVVPPIHQVATLQQRHRPTIGGIQIHFSRFVCTMGFNATDGTERSFITNSHCTRKQGGVEGTEYSQPTRTVDPTVIAVEVEDPAYMAGGTGICPRNRSCRFSDAARARYNAGTGSTQGVIARTSGPNNGSLEVVGSFSVTSQDNATTNFPSGTQVNKVGRTTGWTQGSVTGTCVHTAVQGSKIMQLCQTFVESPDDVLVGGGDSGSGVFRITSGNNVQLLGILWGGSSNGQLFVFSPLKQIRDELGAITATP
ncbi:MAG TPA: hypothetical protein VLE53_04495 [Gemmatimonadaceae bacterium]|nr:hypothetical protein [Gemmatimonadaceae bacterium]